MKKTILVFILIAVLAVSLATAQTIYGRIFDIGGNVLVPGASVKVMINNTINYTTSSLANGSYFVDVNYAVGDLIKVEAVKITKGTATAYAKPDKTEINVTLKPACSDGIDNDGDGLIDSADCGCLSETGVYQPDKNSEANPQCSDNLDNDADTYTDAADPGCHVYYPDGRHEYKCYLNN